MSRPRILLLSFYHEDAHGPSTQVTYHVQEHEHITPMSLLRQCSPLFWQHMTHFSYDGYWFYSLTDSHYADQEVSSHVSVLGFYSRTEQVHLGKPIDQAFLGSTVVAEK